MTAGTCSDVQTVSAEDKEDIARFPFNEEAEFAALGGAKPVGEKGYGTLEQRSAPRALPCYQLCMPCHLHWLTHVRQVPPVATYAC